MGDAIDTATELIATGEYDSAFQILSQTAGDATLAADVRADAYQMLGVLVQISPDLSDGDESGLSHYERALKVSPNHLWAAMGIVSTFGERPYQHRNRSAFLAAEAVVRHQWLYLDAAAREKVQERRHVYDSGFGAPPSADKSGETTAVPPT